jgi:TolB-like protein/Flp pilus assembly protein TadD
MALAWLAVEKYSTSRSRAPSAAILPAAAAISVTAPAISTISEKSVAVLPFVDMSEKKDQEYFSDGMSEELINLLTKIPDLRVPARTSAFYFKGKQIAVADIAHALGVAYVLEGSVRRSGKTLRVTAQLIRADSGYHVWSETYDRPIGDVFHVQDDVASAVVRALKISLSGDTIAKVSGTQNLEAYTLYLQARSIWLHRSGQMDYENVVDYLRRALRADPAFSSAWALLSAALNAQAEFGYLDADNATQEARRAAERAIEVDPERADGHVALASILIGNDWDMRGGLAQLHRALALNPKDSLALSWAGSLASSRGQFDQGIELARKGIESDPVNYKRYQDFALILYHAGRYPEAMTAYRKVLDLNPGTQAIHLFIGQVLLAKGDPAAALAEMDRETDRAIWEQCGCRVLAYDALGRRAEANATLADLEKNHADQDAYDIGLIHANRGDSDQAFAWLDRAYRQHDFDLFWVQFDPLLKNVQSDSRFKALLMKLRMAD